MLGGEKRGVPARRGLTVLGKIPAVPKPINLPSQRLENRGLDPNVEIVPKGSFGWATGRSPPTSAGPWGAHAPPPAGPWGGPAQPTAATPQPSLLEVQQQQLEQQQQQKQTPAPPGSSAWANKGPPPGDQAPVHEPRPPRPASADDAGRALKTSLSTKSADGGPPAPGTPPVPSAWGLQKPAGPGSSSRPANDKDFPAFGAERAPDEPPRSGGSHREVGAPDRRGHGYQDGPFPRTPDGFHGQGHYGPPPPRSADTWRREDDHHGPASADSWRKDGPHGGDTWRREAGPAHPHPEDRWRREGPPPGGFANQGRFPPGGHFQPPGPAGYGRGHPPDPYQVHLLPGHRPGSADGFQGRQAFGAFDDRGFAPRGGNFAPGYGPPPQNIDPRYSRGPLPGHRGEPLDDRGMGERTFGPIGPRGEPKGDRARGPNDGHDDVPAKDPVSKEDAHDQQSKKPRTGQAGPGGEGAAAPTTPRSHGAKEGHIDWASESLDDAMDFSEPPPVFGDATVDEPPKPPFAAEGSEGLPEVDRPGLPMPPHERERSFGERDSPGFGGPSVGRDHPGFGGREPMGFQQRRDYPPGPGFMGPHPGRGVGRGFPGPPGPMMRPPMQFPGMHPGFVGRPAHVGHDPAMHMMRPPAPPFEAPHPRPHPRPHKVVEVPAHAPPENFRLLKRTEEQSKPSEEGEASKSPHGGLQPVVGETLEKKAGPDVVGSKGPSGNGAAGTASPKASPGLPVKEAPSAEQMSELDFDAQRRKLREESLEKARKLELEYKQRDQQILLAKAQAQQLSHPPNQDWTRALPAGVSPPDAPVESVGDLPSGGPSDRWIRGGGRVGGGRGRGERDGGRRGGHQGRPESGGDGEKTLSGGQHVSVEHGLTGPPQVLELSAQHQAGASRGRGRGPARGRGDSGRGSSSRADSSSSSRDEHQSQGGSFAHLSQAPVGEVRRIEVGPQPFGEAQLDLDINEPTPHLQPSATAEPRGVGGPAPVDDENRHGGKGPGRNQRPERANSHQRAQHQKRPSDPQEAPKAVEVVSHQPSPRGVNMPPVSPQDQPPLLALPVHTPSQKGILPDPRQVPRSPVQSGPPHFDVKPSGVFEQPHPNPSSARNRQPRQAPKLADLPAASSQGVEQGLNAPPPEQHRPVSSQDARKGAGGHVEQSRKSPRMPPGEVNVPPQSHGQQIQQGRGGAQLPGAHGPVRMEGQQRTPETGHVATGWGEIPVQGPSGWMHPPEMASERPSDQVARHPNPQPQHFPNHPQLQARQPHPNFAPNAHPPQGAGWVVPTSTQPREGRNEIRGGERQMAGPPGAHVPTGWPDQPRPHLIAADLNPHLNQPRGPIPQGGYNPMGLRPPAGGFAVPMGPPQQQMGPPPNAQFHHDNRPVSEDGQRTPRGHSHQRGHGQRGNAHPGEVGPEARLPHGGGPGATGWGVQPEMWLPGPPQNQGGKPTGWDVPPAEGGVQGPRPEGLVRPEAGRPQVGVQDARKLEQGPERSADGQGEGGARKKRDGRREGRGSRKGRGSGKSENSENVEDAAGDSPPEFGPDGAHIRRRTHPTQRGARGRSGRGGDKNREGAPASPPPGTENRGPRPEGVRLPPTDEQQNRPPQAELRKAAPQGEQRIAPPQAAETPPEGAAASAPLWTAAKRTPPERSASATPLKEQQQRPPQQQRAPQPKPQPKPAQKEQQPRPAVQNQEGGGPKAEGERGPAPPQRGRERKMRPVPAEVATKASGAESGGHGGASSEGPMKNGGGAGTGNQARARTPKPDAQTSRGPAQRGPQEGQPKAPQGSVAPAATTVGEKNVSSEVNANPEVNANKPRKPELARFRPKGASTEGGSQPAEQHESGGVANAPKPVPPADRRKGPNRGNAVAAAAAWKEIQTGGPETAKLPASEARQEATARASQGHGWEMPPQQGGNSQPRPQGPAHPLGQHPGGVIGPHAEGGGRGARGRAVRGGGFRGGRGRGFDGSEHREEHGPRTVVKAGLQGKDVIVASQGHNRPMGPSSGSSSNPPRQVVGPGISAVV
ncbi:hypothetical protein KFL_004760060 [Klebsormidium nitens]|uniref:BAT2 N-terminal domain-containing protein n=1 Tax=Klebsormidium nitens TaxID=105231 RepID=A0A1Y1IIQ3_KLENI|nr:hypothetical protein KFL_004760060 [Klebsormidium nitens]|eukprot:GAQ88991.1 hypothetical protein KFL_004760060 [Klebsormidium nitens]